MADNNFQLPTFEDVVIDTPVQDIPTTPMAVEQPQPVVQEQSFQLPVFDEEEPIEVTDENRVDTDFTIADARQIAELAIGKFVGEVEQATTDPKQFAIEVGEGLYNAGVGLKDALRDGKYDVAGGIITEQLGQRVPGLAQLGHRGRSILGAAVGKQLDILAGTRPDEDFSSSLKLSAKEELGGAVLSKGASFTKKAFDKSSGRTADVLSDKLLMRQARDGSKRSIAEAADALGVERLPAPAELRGIRGKQELAKLQDKVANVTIRSAEDSALIQELAKTEKRFQDVVKAGSKQSMSEIEGGNAIKNSLTNSYKALTNERDVAYEDLNKVIRGSDATLPVAGLRARLEDIYFDKTGGTTNADATKIYNIIDDVLYDSKTKRPKESISLTDWQTLQNTLRNEVSNAAAIPGKAKEIDGIVGKFKVGLMDDYERGILQLGVDEGRYLHPDVYEYLDIKSDINGLDRAVNNFRETPIADALGVNPFQQKAKGASFDKALKKMTSSAADWRASYDQLNEINPVAAKGLKDSYMMKTYTDLLDENKLINSGKLNSLLRNPAKREVLEEIQGSAYVEGLEDIALVMQGQKRLDEIIKTAGSKPREARFSAQNIETAASQGITQQKTGFKNTLANMLLGAKNRLLNTKPLEDGKYLEKIKGEAGLKMLNETIASKVTDPDAYYKYSNLMIHLGLKPVSNTEFNEVINLEQDNIFTE